MDQELEVVQIDENTETISHVLTLVLKHLDPKIDLGPTYEIVARFIVQMIYEPIASIEIEDTSRAMALAIYETRHTLDVPTSKH